MTSPRAATMCARLSSIGSGGTRTTGHDPCCAHPRPTEPRTRDASATVAPRADHQEVGVPGLLDEHVLGCALDANDVDADVVRRWRAPALGRRARARAVSSASRFAATSASTECGNGPMPRVPTVYGVGRQACTSRTSAPRMLASERAKRSAASAPAEPSNPTRMVGDMIGSSFFGLLVADEVRKRPRRVGRGALRIGQGKRRGGLAQSPALTRHQAQ